MSFDKKFLLEFDHLNHTNEFLYDQCQQKVQLLPMTKYW